MKRVVLPKNVDASIKLTAADVLRNMVLILPFWKNESDLKIVNSCLEIDDALDKDAERPVVSDEAHVHLSRAMGLQNGMASIQEPRTNRFYMRVFQAVLRAEDFDPRDAVTQQKP